MKVLALSRTGFAVALSAVLSSVSAPALAEAPLDSIFSKVSPSIRDRAFMRLNYVNANVKTTSGDAVDVTGPVLPAGDIAKYLGTTRINSGTFTAGQYMFNGMTAANYNLLASVVDTGLQRDGESVCPSAAVGVGTPCGIKARSASSVRTAALSVGYYMDDELSWTIEALVLAAPLRVAVYGDGRNGLNGKNIINLKMLPPVAMVGKYFGSAKDTFRPYLGLGGSYAIFFDAKATETLNTYQGGRSPGDTTISLKNTLGFGPFAGFKAQVDDTWHVNLNVGKLRYKTNATLVTRNTTFTSESGVLKDLGVNMQEAIKTGEDNYNPTVKVTGTPAGFTAGSSVGTTTALMCDLARAKYGNTDCNHGTFVRKQATSLDATMFMLSVGRTF